MRITIRSRINKLIKKFKKREIPIFFKGLSLTTETICILYLDSRIHYSMINKAYCAKQCNIYICDTFSQLSSMIILIFRESTIIFKMRK